MKRRTLWTLAILIAVAGGVAAQLLVGDAQPLRVAVGDLLAGVALGCAAVVCLVVRWRHPAGPLLALAWLTWFGATLAAAADPTLHEIGVQTGLAYRGALACAALAVCVAWRSPLAITAAGVAWIDALAPGGGGAWWSLGTAALLVAALFAPAAERRRVGPVALVALVIGGPGMVTLLGRVIDEGHVVLLATDAAIVGAAVAIAVAVVRDTAARAQASDRILEIAGGAGLQNALANVLGVPGVRLLSPDADARAASGQRRTPIPDAAGRPVAVIEHPDGALDDDALRAGVTAAVLLQAEHDEHQRQLTLTAERLHASQRRMVVAADAARARLQRALERDAIARAERLCDDLAADPLTFEAAQELGRAIEELRLLARGLHPPALSEGGLQASLADLAGSAPVTLDVTPDRFAPEIELVVHFTCAEAIANALKHSGARRIDVRVRERDGQLWAEVADDGRGGAQRDGSSGLTGLEGRAAAVGATFEFVSPPGAGTVVRLAVPL